MTPGSVCVSASNILRSPLSVSRPIAQTGEPLALNAQRTLDIGSYQTAWAMLHRLRSVLVRPGRERLTGRVEMDETYIGGEEPGLRGGRAKGQKWLVGIAVEVKEPRGFGRCRMAPLPDASATSLRAFLVDHIEPSRTGPTPP